MNILMGKRIKYARKQQGLTLEKLAEKIGISRNFLWEIEDGRKAPAINTLYNICNELHLSSDYLFDLPPTYNQTDRNMKENIILSICNLINTFDENELTTVYELLKTYNKCK